MCMNRRGIKWIVFFAGILMVLPIIFTVSVFLLPPQYDDTYLGEFMEKQERLEKTEGKKLIIAGGSSAAFGICSDLIEKHLKIQVVNMGLYAPLGSRIMLETCFDEIEAGDIIVFSPEQNQETLSFSFQAESVWQAMDGDYSKLCVFQESEQKQLLGAFPEFAVSKLKYVLEGKPKVSGIYRKSSFNKYGDISSDDRKSNQMPEGYDTTQLIDFSFFPEDKFIRYLNEYAARVEDKGAVFCYRFCPMNQEAVLNEESIDGWYERLAESADFTILGNPHTCVMESGWFFDTNFHLNEAGAIVNTYYFIRDIKAQLRDSTVTDIELPRMPGKTDQIVKGDNSDEDCFIYEKEGGSFVITGVNEKGRQKKELKFPQEHKGIKVSAIRVGSLKACVSLKTVKVYAGMALHDGCFSGCPSLQEIRLLGKPSEITAGRELLKGCKALLYTEYDEEYRLDYTWSVYADRIVK
ncbi:UNVERIFIED_CONTAM: hypothetical protein C7383_101547 [Murimonas intestini]|uniref:Leucine-rich repeat domain-containing protein n=2 Tax=Murimonas intestini TaxID=1337051 RepID=A0AB73TAQ0_9FIRM